MRRGTRERWSVRDGLALRRLAGAGLALAVIFGTVPAALAQGGSPPPAATPADEGQETNPASPRGAVERYLKASRDAEYTEAARSLDLSALPQGAREWRGPKLARMLKSVLDQTLVIQLSRLSNAPDGNLEDGLPANREALGAIRTDGDVVTISLERVTEADGAQVWKFSTATIDQVPGLYAKFGRIWLADYLPAWLFDIELLSIQLWQWIGIAFLVPLSALLGGLLAQASLKILHGTLRRSIPRFELGLMAITARPLQLVLGVIVFIIGEQVLYLPVEVHESFVLIRGALIVAVLTVLGLRLIEVLARSVEGQLNRQARVAALPVVPLAKRVVKILLVVLAVLFVMQGWGFNVTALLAGLGVTGVALAFGAQKTVENLFSGFALVGDQPVRVGDFCRFGDRVGTVETIGLWSTRVRTLERTVVSIPNSTFAFMQLENFARRDTVWFHPIIQLRNDTRADQLRYLLVEIRKLLLRHPKVSPEPARVRFVGFGPSSLNLEIFAYVLTKDINEFLAVQEDLHLRLMELIEASGTGLAVPAQRLLTATDRGLNEERTRAAEQQVDTWRSARSLCLPDLPEDQARELVGTLAYPPEGSATRRS